VSTAAKVHLHQEVARERDVQFVLAGVPIVVEPDDTALLDSLTNWTRQALALTANAVLEEPLRIEIQANGGQPQPPVTARQIAAQGEWEALCDGDDVFTIFTHARGRIRLSAGRASLWLADDWWQMPLKLQQAPWLSTLAWLLRERGRFALHASAVARHGDGLLIAGESGSGKSTTALSLIQAGWDWLADDVALLESGATPSLHGFGRGFSFHPALAERLTGLCGEPVADKRFAAIDGLFAGRRVPTCRPVAVLLPRVTGDAQSRLERASPAEALLALLPASGFILARGAPRRAQAHLRALTDLVRAVPAYRLHAGRDIFGNGGALEALLDRHGIWGAR
jgi:hypothetical protein